MFFDSEAENGGEPVKPRAIRKTPSGSIAKKLQAPSGVLLCLGLSMLALLMMIPVWNACVMWRDPILLYFVGDWVPLTIIGMCAAIMFLYIITIPVFFGCSSVETQTEQTMLNIGTMFFTLLGGLSLLIAYPLPRYATAVGSQLLSNSQYGPLTRPVFTAYAELQQLRNKTGWTTVTSVEECPGFIATPQTRLLKEMEGRLQCCGWGAERPSAFKDHLEPRSLLVSARLAEGMGKGMPVDDPFMTMSPLQKELIAALYSPQPRTLFSTINHTSSCDGMAGRHVKYFLEDVSTELTLEGFYLLSISVVIGFLKLLGLCTSDRPELKMLEYGSLEAARPPYSTDSAEVRRIFQYILRA